MDGFGSGILEWLESHPEDTLRIRRKPRLEMVEGVRPIFALTLMREDGLRACNVFLLEELKAMSPENVLEVLSDMVCEAEEGYFKACSSTSFMNMIGDTEENPA
jgi:hypothetical protein